MYDIQPILDRILDDDARRFLEEALAALRMDGVKRLPVLWPQLARRIGRERLEAGRVEHEKAVVDLDAWRACDAAGLVLIARSRPDGAYLEDLFLHGDFEERAIVLRSLAFLPVMPETVRLFGEMQRTNTAMHFEAGALDSNLVVRALQSGGEDEGFTRDDFHRTVLKTAFMDLPAWRLFGAMDEADATLSGMLQGYATEREAAGRSVWRDTARFLGRAPVPGTVARLLGGLEHGDDLTRLAAAEGLLALAQAGGGETAESRTDVAAFARERLEREPREAVQDVLRRILG